MIESLLSSDLLSTILKVGNKYRLKDHKLLSLGELKTKIFQVYNIVIDSETLQNTLDRYSKENDTFEKTIRDRLALELNGRIEVKTDVGYIDVLTSTKIIEIKQGNDWKAAIGQIISYGSYFPDRKKRIHLFGDMAKGSFDKILKMCKENNIRLTYEATNP